MAAPWQQLVLEAMRGFLASGEYADLTISCQSETFKVHKMVMCARAGFFKKAIEFGGQETHDNKISLDDDQPEVIKLLLQYIYEGDYEPQLSTVEEDFKRSTSHSCAYANVSGGLFANSCSAFPCAHHHCGLDCRSDCVNYRCTICVTTSGIAPPQGSAEQLLLHSQMYECGDKYDVAGLKDLAEKKFKLACEMFWDDATFVTAATHAFNTTPDSDMRLRDAVAQTLKDHLELIDKPEIQVLLADFNGLAFSVLKCIRIEGILRF